MKALSIRQPYAWLIVNGIKPVENRTWRTNFRGRVLIHAGVTYPKRDYTDDLESWGPRGYPRTREEMVGGIVGEAVIVDCVKAHPSPFFFGPYGFVLEQAKAFPKLIPFGGRLGFFGVPESVIAGVEARPVTQQEDRWLRNAAKRSAKVVAPGKLADGVPASLDPDCCPDCGDPECPGCDGVPNRDDDAHGVEEGLVCHHGIHMDNACGACIPPRGTTVRSSGVTPCTKCGQTDQGQTGEYTCPACGLPTVWDAPASGVKEGCDGQQ